MGDGARTSEQGAVAVAVFFSFAFQQRAHTTDEGVLGRRPVGGWEGCAGVAREFADTTKRRQKRNLNGREQEHGISRHQSLVIMNGLPKTSSDSKLQVKPRKRSPSPQPLPTQGLKRNQSSEALIDQLIEKHITRSSTPPPPPTDTPRIAGRPPRPPRARSVGSLQSGSPPS